MAYKMTGSAEVAKMDTRDDDDDDDETKRHGHAK